MSIWNFTLKVKVNQLPNNSELSQDVCIFCPNLVILASISSYWTHGQVQDGVNYDFQVNYTVKVKAITPQKDMDHSQGALDL